MPEPQTDAERRAEEFNAFNPVGTAVLAFPGERGVHKALLTATKSPAWVLPSGDAVVLVGGYAGGIALTHVDVLPGNRILQLSMLVNFHQPGPPWRCSCGWDAPEPKTHALHLGEHLDVLVDQLITEAIAPVRALADAQAAACAFEGEHDACPGHALQRLLDEVAL